MIKAILLCGVLIILNGTLLGQKRQRLPILITIDGNILTSDVYKCRLLIKDSISRVTDSISFNYSPGQVVVSDLEYQRLKSLSSKNTVIIKFNYSPMQSITNLSHTYEWS